MMIKRQNKKLIMSWCANEILRAVERKTGRKEERNIV